MTAADSRPAFSEDSTRCYRVERLYFWVGVVGIPFGVAMGVGSTFEALRNVGGSSANPLRDAAIFAIGFACFMLLCAGLVAYYLKFRLLVSDTEIARIGLLGTKRIDLAQVTRVRWRLIAQDVVLQAGNTRLAIEIDSLTLVDRAELTVFLRTRFSPDMHLGWEQSGRKAQFVKKVEPIHWGRIVGGTVVASALAIPTMFLAAWISPPRQVQMVFAILFFPSLGALLYAAQKLGWITLKPRIQTSDEPVNTPAPVPSPPACRSPVARPSRE